MTPQVSGRWLLFIHSPDISREAISWGALYVSDGTKWAGSPSQSLHSLDEPCLSQDYNREHLTLTERFCEYFSQLCCCLCPPNITERAGDGSGDYKCIIYPVVTFWILTQ